MSSASATHTKTASFAAPFRHTAFTMIWTATVVSNVGGWMVHGAGRGLCREVGLGLATPVNLLVFTLILGAAGALTSPAWQAVVPQQLSWRRSNQMYLPRYQTTVLSAVVFAHDGTVAKIVGDAIHRVLRRSWSTARSRCTGDRPRLSLRRVRESVRHSAQK
jgi:hypothetical protein